MGCAAARAPALRARASPKPRRAWRTSFTSSGPETGRAGSSSGGSEPSSTTTTSSSARGQSCPSSPASVSASASGASKQGTTTLTGSVGLNVSAAGSRIRRQSLWRTAAGRGPAASLEARSEAAGTQRPSSGARTRPGRPRNARRRAVPPRSGAGPQRL